MFPPDAPSWTQVLKELWTPYAWVFVGSLLLALLATPIFRAIARRKGVVDKPDKAVKIHKAPIPYLGGCAIWLAWTVPILLHLVMGDARYPMAELMLLVGGTVAFATGLIDDLLEIKPHYKLIGQALAAGCLLAGGVIWFAWPSLLEFPEAGLGRESWVVLAVCIGVHFLVVLGATNATNLLDGLDGLCSGVTAIIAVGFLLLATSLTAWAQPGWYEQAGKVEYAYTRTIMVVAFALAGAAIGFLPYNFNPARIFMGDAGSVFIGYVLAAMMIMFASRFGMVKWFVGALFIFGLPILDTGMAFLRRVLNHRPVMMPDRSHLYNQLVDRLGLSVRQTVVVFYVLSVTFAATGLLVLYLRGRWATAIFVGLAVAFTIVVWRLGFLKMTPEEQAAADRYLEARQGK